MIGFCEVTTEPAGICALEDNHTQLKDQLDITAETIEVGNGYGNISQIKEIESGSKIKCAIPLPEANVINLRKLL